MSNRSSRYKSVLLILILLAGTFSVKAQQNAPTVRIWEDTKLAGTKVTLMPYLPTSPSYDNTAVIVCPGGSYCWHDMENEGDLVARWLQSQGIAAFVLKYRVQGVFHFMFRTRVIFGGHKHPDMIQDLQRAIQYVRENSEAYHINPDRLGAMGFSAGGHLVMSGACYNKTDFLAPLGIKHTVSLRPDFVAPIYPVVSMSHPDTHKRSRRALLGERRMRNHSMRDSLSLEYHIPDNCPPVFLLNCKDDPIVKYHNSELLDSAMTAHGVNHLYTQYNKGGHGFGANDNEGSDETRKWKKLFLDWLKNIYEYKI